MKIKNTRENIIIALIILAILQILLDEYSRFEHWSLLARNILMLAGLFFDFLFSVEFTVKLIFAARKNAVPAYWKHQRGWIDFLSSYPLLLLNLPAAILLIFGQPGQGASCIAFYNVLIFVKDISITRTWRLTRFIKLFGKIQKTESPMTRHHIAVISTTVVFTTICILTLFCIIIPANHKIKERTLFYDESLSTIKYLENKTGISYKDISKKIFMEDNNLLKLSYKNEIILSGITDEKFRKYYDIGDYAIISNRGFIICHSLVDFNSELAARNIIYFFIVLFIILTLMFIYTRHFIQNINNILNTINKGFRLRQYNERVIIRSEFEQDEVFKLAKFYNDAYLPAKFKRVGTEGINKIPLNSGR